MWVIESLTGWLHSTGVGNAVIVAKEPLAGAACAELGGTARSPIGKPACFNRQVLSLADECWFVPGLTI